MNEVPAINFPTINFPTSSMSEIKREASEGENDDRSLDVGDGDHRAHGAVKRSPDLWLGLIAALLATPLVLIYFGRLWGEEHYQYFPLLIGVILWLAWSRWQEAPPARRPLRRGLVLLLAVPALLGMTLAVLYQVPIMAALSVTAGLGVAGLALASHRKVENLLGMWLLCWLLIRLPWGYDERMMSLLQGATTVVSSRLLDFFGCFHLTEGNVLKFPGKTFFVDEACSGIISLRTILAASAVIVVYRNRPLLHAALLIAAGLFWAGVMNVIRIGVIAVAHLKFDLDLAEGWQHEVTGVAVFIVAVGGVLSTDAFLTFFFSTIGVSARHGDNPLTRFWDRMMSLCDFSLKESDYEAVEPLPPEKRGLPRLFRWSFGAVLAVLLVLQGMVFLPSRSAAESKVVMADMDPASVIDQHSVTPSNPDWQVVDFERKSRSSRSVWGENSLVWTLRNGEGLQMTMSIDYFFRKWHELTVCYRSSGWQLDGRAVMSAEPAPLGEWQTVQATCHRPASHERGLVLFDLFRASGEPLTPVQNVLAADWKERFSLRNLAVFKNAVRQGALEVLQVQAFIVTDEVLRDETFEAVRTEYVHFRDQLYQILMSEMKGEPIQK